MTRDEALKVMSNTWPVPYPGTAEANQMLADLMAGKHVPGAGVIKFGKEPSMKFKPGDIVVHVTGGKPMVVVKWEQNANNEYNDPFYTCRWMEVFIEAGKDHQDLKTGHFYEVELTSVEGLLKREPAKE